MNNPNVANGGKRWPEIDNLSNVILGRQLHFKVYRIFYQIIGKVVLIVGVIDGRRDIKSAMGQGFYFKEYPNQEISKMRTSGENPISMPIGMK